jgi:hypothetical protein
MTLLTLIRRIENVWPHRLAYSQKITNYIKNKTTIMLADLDKEIDMGKSPKDFGRRISMTTTVINTNPYIM